MRRLMAAVVAGVVAPLVLLVASSGGSTAKAPVVGVSVSKVQAHAAKVTGKIKPEGSETAYTIWIDPGCSGGACERFPPREAKTGEVAGGKSTVAVSVTVRELPEATNNNEAWLEATNAVGTTKSKVRVFKTK